MPIGTLLAFPAVWVLKEETIDLLLSGTLSLIPTANKTLHVSEPNQHLQHTADDSPIWTVQAYESLGIASFVFSPVVCLLKVLKVSHSIVSHKMDSTFPTSRCLSYFRYPNLSRNAAAIHLDWYHIWITGLQCLISLCDWYRTET